jgi:hypothetical protein
VRFYKCSHDQLHTKTLLRVRATNSCCPCDYHHDDSRCDWRGGNALEPCTAALEVLHRYSRAAHALHANRAAGARRVLGGYSRGVGGPRRGTPRLSRLHRCGTRRRTFAHTREAEGGRLDRRVLRGYSGALGHRVGRRRGRRRGRMVPSRPAQLSIAARCDGNAHRVQPRIVATPER